jgi:hypothetical protein
VAATSKLAMLLTVIVGVIHLKKFLAGFAATSAFVSVNIEDLLSEFSGVLASVFPLILFRT